MPAKELFTFDREYRLEADIVVCKSCRAAQNVGNASNPFPHADGCRSRTEHQHPWLWLQDILGRMIPAPETSSVRSVTTAQEIQRMRDALLEIAGRHSAASVEGDIARHGLGLPRDPTAAPVLSASSV